MTEGRLYVRSYSEMPLDAGEVLRYSGIKRGGEEFVPTVTGCFEEARSVLTYKAVAGEFPIELSCDGVVFPFGKVTSLDLRRCLDGCEKAVLFGATVGIGIDRLVSKYGRISPSRAIIMQALGAERIEALCNAVSEELSSEYADIELKTTSRFSPGYGDFNLANQRGITTLLDTSRKIGLTLNESLIMSPTKSVTAVIGLKKNKSPERQNT